MSKKIEVGIKELIEDVQKLDKEYKNKFGKEKIITRDYFRSSSKYGKAYAKYGSFTELLDKANIKKDQYNKKELIEEFIRLDKEYKKEFKTERSIPYRIFRKKSKASESVWVNLFGSYESLVKSTGINHIKFDTPNESQVIKDIKRVDSLYKKINGKHKRLSKSFFMESTRLSHIKMFLKENNNFEEMVEKAGIEVSEDPKKYVRKNIQIHKEAKQTTNKTYFVTAHMPKAEVHIKAMQAIETFCKHKNAELVIGLMIGVKNTDPYDPEDPFYQKYYNNFATEYQFNSNVKMKDFTQHPQLVNPFNRVGALMQNECSFIIPHTKQDLHVEASSTVKFPHVGYSTGAISKPTYTADQNGSIADKNHIYGGLIVETEDDEIYHARQVQFDLDGSFIDLGTKYTNKGIKKESPLSATPGDMHFGFEDLSCEKAWVEAIKYTNVSDCIVMHDIFDGKSISHHDEIDIAKLANKPDHLSTLEKEISYCKEKLEFWLTTFPNLKIVIVAANHNEWIDRYLGNGKYIKDRVNYKIALQLANYHVKGMNPLEQYLKNEMGLDNPNLIFLKRDDHYKIAGIKNVHGDYGKNGSRGSANTVGRVYGPVNAGHTHTPAIKGVGWTMGTSSKLDLDYLKGASTWLQAMILTYQNGSRQMIININGKWRLDNDKT